MNEPHQRRVQRFERSVRADLVQRRWLRLHAFMLGTSCFLASWAISTGLMHSGVERLSVRWGLALAVAYFVYLGVLWLWCRWLLSRDSLDPESPLDALDLLQSPGRTEAAQAGTPTFTSGGGGDFGGGGASGSFDVAEGAGDAAKATLEAAASADEGIVVAVPLALVLGVAALIATGLGVAVFGLFGVDVLLGVAIEIAFAAAGGALAFRARREGWLRHATARTAGPLLSLLVIAVLLGAVIDHWLPQANSFPQAVRALRA